MFEKLTKASSKELMAWMGGAFILGVGLGTYLTDYIQQYSLWIILIGLVIHLPAMYKIYSRK